jgi:hypothetical protein
VRLAARDHEARSATAGSNKGTPTQVAGSVAETPTRNEAAELALATASNPKRCAAADLSRPITVDQLKLINCQSLWKNQTQLAADFEY